jgi:hypothetical protein
MKHTPDQRKRMRAFTLRRIATTLRRAPRMPAWGWAHGVAYNAKWGCDPDAELRRELRFLFGIVASYADTIADRFASGELPAKRTARRVAR